MTVAAACMQKGVSTCACKGEFQRSLSLLKLSRASSDTHRRPFEAPEAAFALKRL